MLATIAEMQFDAEKPLSEVCSLIEPRLPRTDIRRKRPAHLCESHAFKFSNPRLEFDIGFIRGCHRWIAALSLRHRNAASRWLMMIGP
ncbi:hypothetical protein [Bradyrhizobium sp.]|uniref:hypothetical protein n=1 Tax=Bradyrhizobium sp. TaxID=376 RepID=UPI003C61E3C4